MGDVRHLLRGNVELLRKDSTVARRLIEHEDKIAVLKDIFHFPACQEVFDVLRDRRGYAAPFSETLPNLHGIGGGLLVFQEQVKFVHKIPCGFLRGAVHGDAVPHLILNNQHTQLFKLLPKLFNVKAHKAVFKLHVGTVVKDVKAPGNVKLQCRRDTRRFRLRLLQKLVVQIAHDRHFCRVGGSKERTVHIPHGAVNDGLIHGLQALLAADDQLTKGKDKVRFQRKRVVVLAVIEVYIHRVYIVRAGRGKPYHLSL